VFLNLSLSLWNWELKLLITLVDFIQERTMYWHTGIDFVDLGFVFLFLNVIESMKSNNLLFHWLINQRMAQLRLTSERWSHWPLFSLNEITVFVLSKSDYLLSKDRSSHILFKLLSFHIHIFYIKLKMIIQICNFYNLKE